MKQSLSAKIVHRNLQKAGVVTERVSTVGGKKSAPNQIYATDGSTYNLTAENDKFYIRNYTSSTIGCVAEYLPSGITQNDVDTETGGVWYDSSGNGLDGVATGATPTNHGLQALTINADGPPPGSNLLAIKNADTTKFVVDENVKVGIGEDSPSYLLEVVSNVAAYEGIYIKNSFKKVIRGILVTNV